MNHIIRSDKINLITLPLISCLVGIMIMAVGLPAYASAGSSNNNETTNPFSTLVPTPNMVAAGGPIPPNYTLAQQEAECTAAEQNAPWYPTMLSYEHHDGNRTHLY